MMQLATTHPVFATIVAVLIIFSAAMVIDTGIHRICDVQYNISLVKARVAERELDLKIMEQQTEQQKLARYNRKLAKLEELAEVLDERK